MDVIEAIKARRDTHKFLPTPVPDQKLQAVLGAARLAPSADGAQPWKFVVIHDEDIKRKLVNSCHGQKWIAGAPVVVVAFALLDQTEGMVGGYMSSYPVDVAFAVGQLMVAAAGEGLGTCFVHRFDEEEVRGLLGAPRDVRVVAITPLGFPADGGNKEHRGAKHLSEIVSYNRFE